MMVTCELFPRKTDPRPGRRHVYLYDVRLDGEIIVEGSVDPAPDLARALLARGMTGKATLMHGGIPRVVINIERLAKLRTVEPDQGRGRFQKWMPYETPRVSSSAADDGEVYPTIPDGEVAA